ncbi:hypothetical protein QW71_24875 [Paenibacillus sp. IHB B 3415]|nr:hypothetical protein QW71_24875 [Paenibacillus sp. IHB B 3415]
MEKRHLILPKRRVVSKQMEKVHLIRATLWIQQKSDRLSVVYPTAIFYKWIIADKLDVQIPLKLIHRAQELYIKLLKSVNPPPPMI